MITPSILHGGQYPDQLPGAPLDMGCAQERLHSVERTGLETFVPAGADLDANCWTSLLSLTETARRQSDR